MKGSEDCFLLSGHLNQDPIENYFGQQRARGGFSENPSVQQVLDNSMSIKQQGSLALMPVRGNSSRKRLKFRRKKWLTVPLFLNVVVAVVLLKRTDANANVPISKDYNVEDEKTPQTLFA